MVMDRNILWKEYRDWLVNEFTDFDMREYSLLMDHLQDTPFRYIEYMDHNRCDDGLELRTRYADDNNMYYREVIKILEKYPCSCLEMLCALADRIDRDYIGEPGDSHPEKLFREFIENLGLNNYHNKNFSKQNANRILDIWLDRRFSRRGVGSILPIRKAPCANQRNVEIWRQMMMYLTEKDLIEKGEL